MQTIVISAVTLLLLAAAGLFFRRVGRDYQTHGKLMPFSSLLEVLIFFLHGSASYAYLDSRLSHINTRSPLCILALLCIAVGLVFTLIAMTRLGMRESVGGQVTGLRQSGLYRYTRNPQVVAGYALLWPSWTGLLWIAVYAAIAHLMVRTEEEHLKRVYGAEYAQYCARTPRYIGFPNRNT